MFKNFFRRSGQKDHDDSSSHPNTPNNNDIISTNNNSSSSVLTTEQQQQQQNVDSFLNDPPMTVSSILKDSNKNQAAPALLSISNGKRSSKRTQDQEDDDDIEYFFIEDNPFIKNKERPTGSFGPLPMRNTSDRLQYGTGAIYLLGLTTGGTYGFFRGLRKATGNSFKLRLNSVLNTVTRYGPWAANSMGIMTLGWTAIDSAIVAARGGQSDYWNHVSAAFVTGFIFKSTAGLRPATLQGAILASVVSSYGLYTKYQEGTLNLPSFQELKDKVITSSSNTANSAAQTTNQNVASA